MLKATLVVDKNGHWDTKWVDVGKSSYHSEENTSMDHLACYQIKSIEKPVTASTIESMKK